MQFHAVTNVIFKRRISFSLGELGTTTTVFFLVHYLGNLTLYYLFIHTLSSDDPLSPIVIYC